MAMVISTRAKLVITALILFFLLGIVLVTGSTKGWFIPQRFNGERVAARIQVTETETDTNVIHSPFSEQQVLTASLRLCQMAFHFN